MKCPRCESATLDERDRDGIVIDVCKSCRGLWLDRGELEKLIARATRDLDELVEPPRSAPSPREPPPREPDRAYQEQRYRDSTPPRGVRYDDGRGYYDDDRRYHRRKKSWIESLGDIFD